MCNNVFINRNIEMQHTFDSTLVVPLVVYFQGI